VVCPTTGSPLISRPVISAFRSANSTVGLCSTVFTAAFTCPKFLKPDVTSLSCCGVRVPRPSAASSFASWFGLPWSFCASGLSVVGVDGVGVGVVDAFGAEAFAALGAETLAGFGADALTGFGAWTVDFGPFTVDFGACVFATVGFGGLADGFMANAGLALVAMASTTIDSHTVVRRMS
jgi:hypothetical protein